MILIAACCVLVPGEARAGERMILRYDVPGGDIVVTEGGSAPTVQDLKLTRSGDTFIFANPPGGFTVRDGPGEFCDAGSRRAFCPVEGILTIAIRLGGGGDDALAKVTPSGRVRIAISGEAGSDRIKATVGRQVINGGPGDDVLRGGPGRDVLVGGPGTDSCRGGPARDVQRGCE